MEEDGGRGEPRVITESGKPVCWRPVPSVLLPHAGFRTSLPTGFCVLVAGSGREDGRLRSRRASAWPREAGVQLKRPLILVRVRVSFSSLTDT